MTDKRVKSFKTRRRILEAANGIPRSDWTHKGLARAAGISHHTLKSYFTFEGLQKALEEESLPCQTP